MLAVWHLSSPVELKCQVHAFPGAFVAHTGAGDLIAMPGVSSLVPLSLSPRGVPRVSVPCMPVLELPHSSSLEQWVCRGPNSLIQPCSPVRASVSTLASSFGDEWLGKGDIMWGGNFGRPGGSTLETAKRIMRTTFSDWVQADSASSVVFFKKKMVMF